MPHDRPKFSLSIFLMKTFFKTVEAFGVAWAVYSFLLPIKF